VFDREMIERFCRITRDENLIHNWNFMVGKCGKFPIVPGLEVLASFGDSIKEGLANGANYLDVKFGNFLSANEGARLEFSGGDLSVYANDSDGNILSKGDEGSRLCLVKEHEVDNYESSSQTHLDFETNDLEDFADLLKIRDRGIRDSFFSLSLASGALFDRMRNPENEVEEDWSDKYFKGDRKVLPVYDSIRVFLPSRDTLRLSSNGFDFLVSGKKLGKRDYRFLVNCREGDFPIYTAELDVKAMREDMLIRGARDSTVEQ